MTIIASAVDPVDEEPTPQEAPVGAAGAFGTGSTDTTITTIKRGLDAAPVLRDGLGLTFFLAA
ncbi:MAG: hypothetical protein ACI83Y_000070, partial [Candidatus Azotimanducaceae bacterium]